MIGRREFLHKSLAAGAAGVLLRRTAMPLDRGDSKLSPNPNDSRIEVLTGEPLGIISPNVYGHFAENLSGVIYDGIWVGRDSKVPNVDGIRKELIDEMRKIKAPVVRFPGGVSRTATTGATVSVRWGKGPVGPTSGTEEKPKPRPPVIVTIPTNSVPTNSRTFAS
jgi:hypothetical protein